VDAGVEGFAGLPREFQRILISYKFFIPQRLPNICTILSLNPILINSSLLISNSTNIFVDAGDIFHLFDGH
jgi:hypothetical protein